jgi:hypothetical protein
MTSNTATTCSSAERRGARPETVTVSATSREGIGVADEQLWRVASLAAVRPWSCLSNGLKA